MRGVVVAFDDPAGWGTVEREDGTAWSFHCTAIADGTRTIAAGTSVVFRLVPGHLGRWEAADLQSV